MKNFTKIILFTVLTILVSSCGNNKEHEHAGQEASGQEHHGDEHGIMLNDGKPWMANSETTQGIHNMSALWDGFKSGNDIEEYHALQEDLLTEFNTIIKECTMEGDSHEQLHNYLLPMKDLISDLGSDDISVCNNSVDLLKKYLSTYPKYFE